MKKKTKILVFSGITCFLLLLLSTWYAVVFNGSRLVAPMDFSSYTFQVQDLPMLFSLVLVCIYGAILLFTFIISAGRSRRKAEDTNTTRRLNPKLGLLGILGFLGFTGFWTHSVDGSVFPFVFFLFFGFFGFYYEGKMSGTFMDERFRENAARARLRASDITFRILFIALVILCQGKLLGNLEHAFIAGMIILSLALALRIFLSEYLLYRYDHDDLAEEE